MFSHVVIACLFGMAAAAPSAPIIGAVGLDSVSIPRYNFNYAVSDPVTGDNKAQTEIREGGVVKGSYSLAEPDGTLRVVDYAADPISGFNAVVKRIGPAAHPQPIIAAPVVTKQIVAPIAAPIVGPAAIPVGVAGLGLGGHGLGLGGHGLGGLDLGHGLGGIGLGDIGLGSIVLSGIGIPLGGIGVPTLGLGGLGLKH